MFASGGRGGGGVCCELVAVCESVQLCKLSMKGTQPWPLGLGLFGSSSSCLNLLYGSLRPSSQVSRAALGLLRYDGLGRGGHLDGLVSLPLSLWRHEFRVVQQMRRLKKARAGVLRRGCVVVVVVFVLVPPPWV
jgi:hypothetical protein